MLLKSSFELVDAQVIPEQLQPISLQQSGEDPYACTTGKASLCAALAEG